MLSAQLVQRGYPAEHVLRALEKNDFDVEAAAKWIDQNKEWLLATEDDDLATEHQPEVKTAAVTAPKPAPVAVNMSYDVGDIYDDGYYSEDYDYNPMASMPPPMPAPAQSALLPEVNGPVSNEVKLLESTWARFARENPDKYVACCTVCALI